MSLKAFNTATRTWDVLGTAAASAASAFATAAQGVKADASAQWTKYTKTFADLSTAGLTNNIELFSLAAKEMIHAVIMKCSTLFTGGAIATYTLSVGITGTLGKYVAILDAKQAVGNQVFGPGLAAALLSPENFGASTSIKLSAISTVANLNAATQGSVDVFVLKSTLP